MKNFLMLLLFMGCGAGGGTSTGNPIRVTIQSSAYTEPSFTTKVDRVSMSRTATKINLDFKICVAGVVFENSEDERIEISFDDIGLVDLSDPTVVTTWGKLAIEEGEEFEFDTVIVVAEVWEDLCGVEYSMRFKGEEITSEFELFFEYDPDDFDTDEGDFYRLDVEVIADAANDAITDGEFNDSEWADYIDDFIGGFEEDDDEEDDEDVFGD